MFDESSRYYDLIYSFKDYEREARRIEEIAGSRAPNAKSLLDVACGTGAHMAYLRASYEVQGLDVNEDLLELCRKRNPEAPLHVGDMRSFSLSETFDLVVNLFSSIGYMTTERDLGTAVSNMAGHLNPGGALIVEPWLHPEDFEDGRVDLLTVEEGDLKIARVSYGQREGAIGRLRFDYLVAGRGSGTRYVTETHEMGLFTPAQYVASFEGAGLRNVERDEEGLMGRGLIIGVAS